ncbi:MAG: hypothetical protein WCC60_15440 [Ilumatobacteraceae bacterium]
MIHRRRKAAPPEVRDEGSALVIAMAFVLIGALFVLPALNHAIAVTKAGGVQQQKLSRAESVKAALRVALADGPKLYDACANSGLHTEVTLGDAGLGVPVETVCTTVKSSLELSASELRVPMTTTMAGSTAPLGTVGTPYSGSGNANETLWVNDIFTTSVGGKILLPNLPSHALTHPSSAGYMMPAWAGSCRVFFPGTYNDPITISDSVPVFFASGIYYFDDIITVSGSANVVVGGGAVEGCTTDQEGAFNALGAPSNHNISGYGATWIFGGAGRLVFTDTIAGSGPSLQFNSRLVNATDVASLSSRGVSILTVNGYDGGGGSALDLSLPGQLFVPHSNNDTTPVTNAMSSGYAPSTLHPDAVATPFAPVIDVNLTTANPARLWIPGYVGVPQGYVNINVSTGMAAGKDVQMVGGVLAAYFTQTGDMPANLQLGVINRVVQRTFKVVSTTKIGAGTPRLVSTALVQMNDFGDFVINAWEISLCRPDPGNSAKCLE